MKPRYWHIGLCAAAAAAILGLADFIYIRNMGALPRLRDIWWLSVLVPVACGAVVTLGCGGAALWKRIIATAACGVATGVLYTAIFTTLGQIHGIAVGETVKYCGLWIFTFAILSTIGAIATELKLPDPDLV